MDSAMPCPPGQVDANGDPSDGCEYACTPTASTAELCDGLDNDCDPSTPDGASELTLGDACDGEDTDLCQEGHVLCSAGALSCDDATSDAIEVCNGLDDDCDPTTLDGADEVGTACDGDDPDSCAGGLTVCVSGAIQCDDPGGAGVETCDGVDNDCDPSTPDGSADPMLGDACDGADADLCAEGTLSCVGGALSCDDTTGDVADVCNGVDDDCDPSTVDGSADPMLGDACDGPDRDLCAEGALLCAAGALSCDDATGDILDVCDGADNDCNPSTADGSGDSMLGDACDGPDADLCAEGTLSCVGGALSCGDTTGDTLDVCDGVDNDCRPGTVDGSADPMRGVACDGADSDLCPEGTLSCVAGALSCDDTSSNNLDICNGIDDDCRPGTADGLDDPLLGVACDGADTDLCKEGANICSGGSIACDDATGDNLEICDGVDNDCRPGTADGVDDPFLGDVCDGADSDFCAEGVRVCTGGGLVCNDTTGDTLDVCDGVDNDCNPISPDGSGETWFGAACDGPDSDVCTEGVAGCALSVRTCSDTTGDSTEICNGIDDDCDGSIDEGNVCSGCRTQQFGGHAYLFCGANNWSGARGNCRTFGNYDLATVGGAAEQAFVVSQAGGNDHWIGLNDRGSEGTYVWSSGTALGAYNAWGSGEPNDGGLGQDCVELWSSDSLLWHDVPCGLFSRYICESL